MAAGSGNSPGTPDANRAASFMQVLSGIRSWPRPSASLDPLIDATERAVSRNGLRRTTMSDLAREMKVARTTLYRQVDSVDEAIVLAGARTAWRFIDDISVDVLSGESWSNLFVEAVIRAISIRHENPLLRRILEHEPEMLGEFAVQDGARSLMQRVTDISTPVFTTMMATGQLKASDPKLASEYLARAMFGLLLVPPPPEEVRRTVEFILAPMLPAESKTQ
jgi:AcrR family transcriptional regulator